MLLHERNHSTCTKNPGTLISVIFPVCFPPPDLPKKQFLSHFRLVPALGRRVGEPENEYVFYTAAYLVQRKPQFQIGPKVRTFGHYLHKTNN